MENSKNFELLEEQLKNNEISWYPFEDAVHYEIIKEFTKDKKQQLEDISKTIDENDRVILMMNNRLGVVNICENNESINNLFNKNELEDLLDSLGFKYRKFYYPLPNYTIPNVIFTDKHLPNLETINRNITFYNDTAIITNDQNEIFKEIIKLDNRLFAVFTNSFFVECSKKEFEDNAIEFVSFSNIRKEEYQIQTIIKNNSVYKKNSNEKSKGHINNIVNNIGIMNEKGIATLDSYKENCIVSSYQRDKDTLEWVIVKEAQNNGVECAKQLIKDFYEELKQKLEIIEKNDNVFDKYNIEYKDTEIEQLNFVKNGLWDLVFQNAFYIDKKFYFYDQEWYEENIPVEFIMYRSYKYSAQIQKIISKEDYYAIIGINDSIVELFDKLDMYLQEKIRDDNSWNIHAYSNNYLQIIQQIKDQKEQMNKEALILLNQKDAYIKKLEDTIKEQDSIIKNHEKQMAEQDNKIQLMENSIIWKIRNVLRGKK